MRADRSAGGAYAWVVVIVLVALTVLGAWLLTRQERVPVLERSAIGFDGLPDWLGAHEIETRRFTGRGPLSGDGVGLRILPVYDANLGYSFQSVPVNAEQRFLSDTQRQIAEYVVSAKVESLPTLVVLPKWRDGIRQMGAAHPEFLIHRAEPVATETGDDESAESDAAGAEPEVEDAPIDMPDEAEDDPVFTIPHVLAGDTTDWVDVPLGEMLAGTARLRAPQWVEVPQACEALIGTPERALLMSCPLADGQYWVLSDPDVLNNHGLAQGDNARLAVALIRELANGGDVLLDYSTAVFLTARPDEHQRSWADILRMFEPPFTALWMAAAGLLALLLWRAGVRGRPLLSIFEHGHGAARRVALQAQARLMRNAHADGALIRTLVAARKQALAEAWLGRERRVGGAFERAVALLRQKDAALADRVTDIFARADALPDRIRPAVAVDALADVEDVYKLALELA